MQCSPSSQFSMPASTVVFLLALMMGIQPVTTDLYLPALPALASHLNATMAQAQYTLSALLLAFGISQLVWGPLSDRFGRKPILMTGLSAYIVASVGSAFAGTIDLLIYWRILQGLAMGAVVMCGRALVRDLYAPLDGAKVMSKGLSGLGVIACLSAPVGGWLVSQWNTTAALLALVVFGAVTLWMVISRFEETLTNKNPKALQMDTLVSTWWVIFKNPTFLTYNALSSASYGVLFMYLASSSFVFIKGFGMSATGYGMLMFLMSLHYIGGTFLCRRLLARFGIQRTLAIAGGISLAGGLAMGSLLLLQVHSAWAIAVPFYLIAIGHGIHQPCGQTGAIGPFPQAAGAASAMNGFLMMAVAFVTGLWLSTNPTLHSQGDTTPLVMGVVFWTVCVAIVAWTAVQKYGKQ